jgi:nicotinate phosphoribosyltransferase
VYDGPNGGVSQPLPSIHELRSYAIQGLAALRPDIKRNLNPTPYKVSLSETLYEFLHKLWEQEAPIKEMH